VSWHIDEPAWQAYTAGRLDPAAEAAVEMHVTACTDCRAGARALMPDPEPLWQAIHAEITRPRLPWPLRALARLGVPEDDVVVLAGTRDLLLSWSLAVGAAVLCAIVTGLAPARLPGGPQAFFLILAPLVPVLAVVATYDATDPFREVAEATPFSKLRLALLRTSAALIAAIPLTVAVALTVPNLRGYFATWLLPGLALTVITLILLTWLTAWVACAVTSAGWITAASIATGKGAIDAVATTAGQVGFAVAVVALAAVFVRTGTVQHARGVVR
jgi:putative zinc finger protein